MYRCISVIPVRESDLVDESGSFIEVGGKDMLTTTLEGVINSRNIQKVFVATDTQKVADRAQNLGAFAPFVRPKELSEYSATVPQVIDYTLKTLAMTQGIETDAVVSMSCYYPFRKVSLIDQVIDLFFDEEFHSVFTASKTSGNYWFQNQEKKFEQIFRVKHYQPRSVSEPLYRELQGLVCVTKSQYVREESILGNHIGVVPIHDIVSTVDLRDPTWKEIHQHIDVSKIFY